MQCCDLNFKTIEKKIIIFNYTFSLFRFINDLENCKNISAIGKTCISLKY